MAWDDIILHDAGGVQKVTLSDNLDGDAYHGTALCGVGLLHFCNKPSIPFGKGVVSIYGPTAHRMCDDPQLVAALVRAYAGYTRGVLYHGVPQYLPEDPEFDFDRLPVGDVPVMSPKESYEYLLARNILMPGVPP